MYAYISKLSLTFSYRRVGDDTFSIPSIKRPRLDVSAMPVTKRLANLDVNSSSEDFGRHCHGMDTFKFMTWTTTWMPLEILDISKEDSWQSIITDA